VVLPSGAEGVDSREVEPDEVERALGEKVAEALQVKGAVVPKAGQAPGQGQGRGAARAGVGQ
jgi:hypothetical protein